ncbi:hypothetical protein VPFG_00060 [Vibrio phage nt-1]|uniref:Uncharacterized protein n=1 Tax=Vibrio phage nt-1 TaxID=115992 RepID=R9TG45_9CAUD|nr:hypothetical protein VPFG_00060 [Vibrio phage nt-1]AGN30063.1 hypothetical protein VPFG_00060 [Vibrio phage nt-1]
MLYINLTTRSVTSEHSVAQQWLQERHDVQSRWDWDCDTIEQVAEVCKMIDDERYMVTDAGAGCSPRFDIIEKPQVGDEVSYAFNGDYYPDGEIAKISKTMKMITTTTGKKYYRKQLTGRWVNAGTWTLVQGHVSKLNEEF